MVIRFATVADIAFDSRQTAAFEWDRLRFSRLNIKVDFLDWFFAINESSAAFHIYAPLAKGAVHTARTQTSLRPRMLYDGAEIGSPSGCVNEGLMCFSLRVASRVNSGA